MQGTSEGSCQELICEFESPQPLAVAACASAAAAASLSAGDWGFKNSARGLTLALMKLPLIHEASESIFFWTACRLSVRNMFGILTSRVIDWYRYGSNRGGGGVGWSFGGVIVILGEFSSFFLDHGILIVLPESSAQAQSIATPFNQIG